MISTKGIYFNGNLKLENPITSEKPLKVIVTFLEETEESNQDTGFSVKSLSLDKSRKLLADFKGSFSDAVIKERRDS